MDSRLSGPLRSALRSIQDILLRLRSPFEMQVPIDLFGRFERYRNQRPRPGWTVRAARQGAAGHTTLAHRDDIGHDVRCEEGVGDPITATHRYFIFQWIR